MDTNYSLEVRIARIVDTPIPLDLRYQVRVMPDMADIQETNLLPKYPSFFTTENISALKDEYVWVVCNNDFSLGYVLGLASPATPDVGIANENQEMKYMFESVLKHMEIKAGLLETSKFADLYISHFNEHMMDLYNTTNGCSATVYKNGMYFLMDAKTRVIRYGIDDSTYITMKKGQIEIVAEQVRFTGSVALGSGGKSILTADLKNSYTLSGLTIVPSNKGTA